MRSRQRTASTGIARAGALVFLAALASAPAAAVTTAYHSPKDDGVPGAGVPEGGVQSVFLYVDGGALATTTGSACHDGNGEEICGYELHLSGQNGLTLVSFDADAGADVVANLLPGELRINGLDSDSPSAGPKRIGVLTVNAVTGGAVALSAGEVIGADLSSETLAPGTFVTVPEPGSGLGLIAGASMLCLIGRRSGSFAR